MTYYAVADVTDREVRADDGALLYAVSWEGYEDEQTWERRPQLTPNCAEMVQAVDQRSMDVTDEQVLGWRRQEWGQHPTTNRKRSRSPSPTCPEPPQEEQVNATREAELLSAVLLRSSNHTGEAEMQDGTALLLGEVVLSDAASAALNNGGTTGGSSRRRRPPAEASAQVLTTAPALDTERRWRELHGQSLLHSVAHTRTITPVTGHYHIRGTDQETEQLFEEEAQKVSHLHIVSIAPPSATISGAMYAAPITLEGLVGDADVQELRQRVQSESSANSNAAQELVRPHVEQMVVRYLVPEQVALDISADGSERGGHSVASRVASMPLSVFRRIYPQLLIDFLLQNSVVLH